MPQGEGLGSRTIPGETVPTTSVPPAGKESAGTQADGQYFATTTNNPVTSESTAPVGRVDGAALSLDRMRLAGAATEHIASGTTVDEVVTALADAAVPQFADGILVYLSTPLQDYETLRPHNLRLAHRTHVPAESSALAPLILLAPEEDLVFTSDGALAEILANIRPIAINDVLSRAALAEIAAGPLPGQFSAIIAPLQCKWQLFGFAVLIRYQRAPYDDADVLVAAQMATHSALGIDRALLARSQEHIADELQRTMLPETLPRPTGVRLAFRYLPAAETARVGGDWYDAIPLPGSRVALVVGDVMGHSMTSAAIMGQLRTTAQTLAGLDLPPQEVLHHLDEQAQRLGTDRMATCLYAVYDPVAHRITIANAGHPPPVLLHLGGRAEVLRVPPSAPVGVGGVDFEAVELDAPAGATLLLYTDGLVESRLRDVWTGIEQLREKLAATAQLTGADHPPPLEALCDEVLDMLGPGDRDDDIALLAARFDGIAPSDVAFWHLDPEAKAPGLARKLTRGALTRWELDSLADSVELLVSELVTNAVRYTSRPITLRLLRSDVLRCEVADDVSQPPRLRHSRTFDEGGRGLFLVNKLSMRWGSSRLATGKIVWFEMALSRETVQS
ncbi:SpoIIE family protein phosphatase [Streptomyces sp. NBC_00258]|uniref:SpoIIE family protein phosphatase n=1 Tax=Streptomyces sp. NBC_00258 TaxID=2903642 RepID=UPI003FA795E3